MILVLNCVIIIFSFVKVNFFLRAFDGFSFLVSMMIGVFKELRHFMAFFAFAIFEFGILFSLLLPLGTLTEGEDTTYEGIDIVSYYMMVFQASVGDFDVDLLKSAGDKYNVVISWLIWVVAALILNVIFMNFIIAVISESYE